MNPGGRPVWHYLEFGWRCNNWKRHYRTFYTRPVYDDRQGLLEFARPDNVIITNLGVDLDVLKHCSAEERATGSNRKPSSPATMAVGRTSCRIEV